MGCGWVEGRKGCNGPGGKEQEHNVFLCARRYVLAYRRIFKSLVPSKDPEQSIPVTSCNPSSVCSQQGFSATRRLYRTRLQSCFLDWFGQLRAVCLLLYFDTAVLPPSLFAGRVTFLIQGVSTIQGKKSLPFHWSEALCGSYLLGVFNLHRPSVQYENDYKIVA